MASEAAAAAAPTSGYPTQGENFVNNTLGRINALEGILAQIQAQAQAQAQGFTTLETRIAQLMERDVANTNDAIMLYNQVQALENKYQGVTPDSISSLIDEKIKTGLYLRGDNRPEYKAGGNRYSKAKVSTTSPR